MDVSRRERYKRFPPNLIPVGGALALIYWIIESIVHSFVFHEGSFLTWMIYPDVHEIWMRTIVVVLLINFSIYGQSIINQRKRAEQALTQREKEAQRILENNPAAIVLIDCTTRSIAYANHNAMNLIGAPAHRIVGRHCQQFLCPAQDGSCPLQDLIPGADISERHLITADRKMIPILKSVTHVDYKGKRHFLEAFFDVTEQKKMRQAIQQAHAELDQIFQTASVGMRLIDGNFNILKINQAFAKLAGVTDGMAKA